MNPTREQLLQSCHIVRMAAQQISDEQKIPYFSSYPIGWCGCVSRVLGAWLLCNFPDNEFYYVCGHHEGTHAWIEHNGVILDITADQFIDCQDKACLLPLKESYFHQKFRIESRRLCDITDIDYYEEGLIFGRALVIFKTHPQFHLDVIEEAPTNRIDE